MATLTAFHFYDNSTLANFKARAQEISNFFTTAGWAQTADTGQVNWSTIATVPGSLSYVYEIWKSTDALSSTFPMYIKIEYGTGSTTNAPTIRFSTGTGTDGSGNITTGYTGPQVLTLGFTGQPSNPTTFYMRCRFSGDTGRFWFSMFEPTASSFHNGHMMLAIGRSVNSSGARTSTYFTTWFALGYSNGSAIPIYQYTTLNGGNSGGGVALPYNTGIISPLSGSNAGGVSQSGTNGPHGSLVAPSFAAVGYWDFPHPCILIGPQFQYLNGTLVTVTIYGATHTYTVFAQDNSSNTSLASWWVVNARFLQNNNLYT